MPLVGLQGSQPLNQMSQVNQQQFSGAMQNAAVQQSQLMQNSLVNNSNNANLPMRTNNIRGVVPAGNVAQNQIMNQPLLQPNNLQQNISRPTTLSLGPNNLSQQQQQPQMNDWNNNSRLMQAQAMGPTGNLLNQQQLMNQASQFTAANQLMMQPQQQQQQNQMMQQSMMNSQQQQQQGGGVLSNLLSSGKQIIGAATTPRAPNQPSQFPSSNQQQQQASLPAGMGLLSGPMQQQAGGLNMMDPMSAAANSSRANLIQGAYGMQNASANSATNLTSLNLNDPASAASLMNSSQGNPLMQQHGNSFNLSAGLNRQQPMASQQQQQQPQQHFPTSSIMAGLNRGLGPIGGQHQQQHGLGDGDQGGPNILNTVKNMFKL